MVNSPDLLFLDEPTTGLDPNARRAIWEVIRELKARGKTIILTTHYLDEAEQFCDMLVIMNHGRIVARGTSDEIIRQHGSGERLEIHGDEALATFIKANTELNVDFRNGVISIPLRQKTDALRELEAAANSKMERGEIRTKRDSLDDVFVRLVSGVVDELGEIISEKSPG